VDQQWRVGALQRLEHRSEVVVAGRAGERLGRDAGAGEAAVQLSRQRRRIGLGEADRRPGVKRPAQRGDALVVGRQQRLGLPGGQRLDAERDGGRDQHALEAVGLRERRALRGVVVGQVDGRLRLTGQAQRPAVAAAHQHRRLAPLAQRAQERLGPEMLVDVGGGAQVRR
jgi:hypothetical protein